MRVALVTAHYPPKLSGHADFCGHLAQALVDEALDVSVVVLGAEDVADDLEKVDVAAAPFPGTWSDMTEAVKTIEATDPDVICLQFEAHAFRLKQRPHLLALRLRCRGHRVVMTYHELWKPGRFGHAAKAILLNSAHRVVAFSHWHAEGIARFRKIGTPADIIACGSNIVRPVTADRRLMRARFDIPDDVVLFTFFGFVMIEHKVEELLTALSMVREQGIDARLQLIGRFDPEVDGYHQRLVNLVGELRLGDAVTWHGRVMDDADVARLIQVSDAGVLPYDTGVGENNGAFAALAHYGIPTVTTRGERSNVMEQVDVARFTEPTAEGLAEGMLDLARDTAGRELLSKRVAEWASRRSWKLAGLAYAELLRGTEEHIEVI